MYIERRHHIVTLILFFAIIALAFVRKNSPIVTYIPSGSTIRDVFSNLKVSPSFFEKESGGTHASSGTSGTTGAIPGKAAAPAPPTDGIYATSYLAGNIKTGTVYLERNSSAVLPIASMSKLVTALAATDSMKSDTPITITAAEADVPPDVSGIRTDEKFTLQEIMYPLLLASSNVAAEAIASSSNRAKFLDLMNGYAWEVGMPSSYFADPSGLSPRNAASAKDYFALARYLFDDRRDLLDITRTPHVSISTTTDHGSHDFSSTHPFVDDPHFLGGKTGRTPEAGDTMLTIMNINNQPIAIVVLDSRYDGRTADTKLLIDRVTALIK